MYHDERCYEAERDTVRVTVRRIHEMAAREVLTFLSQVSAWRERAERVARPVRPIAPVPGF